MDRRAWLRRGQRRRPAPANARRHPPRAAAVRMPRYEGPPTTQRGGRGCGATGRAVGVRAFNWARHPDVTSRATPARGDGGTGWRRASDGDARAAEEVSLEAPRGKELNTAAWAIVDAVRAAAQRTALPENSETI